MKTFAGTLRMAFFVILATLVFVPDIFAADRGMINSGETKIGINLVGPSYMDNWTFNGNSGNRVIINAIKTSGSLNTSITLYPPDGGPAEASDNSGQLNWQLLKSGLYTIVISDWSLTNLGTYNVSLTKIPTTLRPGLYNPCPPVGGLTSGCCSTLHWDAVAGATGYDVYYRTDPTQPVIPIVLNTANTTVPLPQVQNGQICLWQVVAYTPTGTVVGPGWWFTTFAADFNRDGKVNFRDFAALASHWRQDEPSVDIAPLGGDGIVNFLDLKRLSQEWLHIEPCY